MRVTENKFKSSLGSFLSRKEHTTLLINKIKLEFEHADGVALFTAGIA